MPFLVRRRSFRESLSEASGCAMGERRACSSTDAMVLTKEWLNFEGRAEGGQTPMRQVVGREVWLSNEISLHLTEAGHSAPRLPAFSG